MADELDVSPKEVPGERITTKAQALGWVQELTSDMLRWREKCNVVFPDKPEETALFQKRALWTFLEKHGEVIGALKTLRLVGLIDERAYQEYNQRALNTLIPDVVGQA